MKPRIGIGIFVLAIATVLALASTVFAADLPEPNLNGPAYVAAAYTGWGYVASTTSDFNGTISNVHAWRWTATGWASASLGSGSSIRVYPFGSGWSWAYRDNNWYAIRTTSVASWSCSSGGFTRTIPPINADPNYTGGPDTRAFRFNSSRATVVGNVARGSSVTILCGNTFPSAYDLRYATTRYTIAGTAADGSTICGFTGYWGGAAPFDHDCTHIEEPFVLVRATINGSSMNVYIHAVTGFETPHFCCVP